MDGRFYSELSDIPKTSALVIETEDGFLVFQSLEEYEEAHETALAIQALLDKEAND